MATNEVLRRRVEEFVEGLAAEFGPVAQGKYNCLLSAIEYFWVQVGDEVAKSIAQKTAAEQIVQTEPSSECCCPVWMVGDGWVMVGDGWGQSYLTGGDLVYAGGGSDFRLFAEQNCLEKSLRRPDTTVSM